MEMTQDKLVNSPICDSDACYESEFMTAEGPVKTWLCMTSGFTSNTTMEEGSEVLKQAMENTSKFILSLKQVHDGLTWFPTVITMPDKGMIFPEPIKGTKTLDSFNKEDTDWKWTVVKSIPVKEEEKEKYPMPNKPGEFYKTKMDMKNMKRYDRLCFMDAAEELGMFNKPKITNED
tara:strand:+ start:1201 stop:1728 length:528 start_codon:yes stop_codon:yes gene_type:complete